MKTANFIEQAEQLLQTQDFPNLAQLSQEHLEEGADEGGLYYLVLSLHHLGRDREALVYADQLITLCETNALFFRLRALVHQSLNNLEHSFTDLQRAFSIAPEDPETHYNLGSYYSATGDKERALESLFQATQLDPFLVSAWHALCLTGKITPDSPEMTTLYKLLKDPRVTQKSQTLLHYGLGAVYDKQGDYEKAFSHFSQANALKGCGFEIEKMKKEVEHVCQTFTKAYFDSLAWHGSYSTAPIFIVGMPRSGTTLLESIVGKLPGVLSCGERPLIPNFALQLQSATALRHPQTGENVRIPYPHLFINMNRSLALSFAREYLGVLRGTAYEKISDKLPLNFLYLMFIAMIFPKAKIIHCTRNPLDTCFSCYALHFTHQRLSFTNDLNILGQYFNEYQKLMRHWKEHLPLAIHEVTYENMVKDPYKQAKEVASFCDIPWDPTCLEQKERSSVFTTTASQWQIREEIYSSSIGRAEKYRPFIQSLVSILGG